MLKLLLLAALLAQESTVDQLIRQLGADDVDDRNRATQELRKRGMAAVPGLTAAVESKDVEVVSRAREALTLILDDLGYATLKAFEEALEKATSFRVTSRSRPTKEPLVRFSAECSLERKTGGKIRVTGAGHLSEESWKGFLVSDGERMMLETEGSRSGQRDWGYDGKDYWPTVRAAAARIGAGSSANLWAYIRVKDLSVAELFRLGDWKCGEEGKLRSLEYSIRWAGDQTFTVPKPVGAKTWYDPVTFRPVKRLLKFSTAEGGPVIIEEFSYDADMPDETFRVPERKQK